MPHINLEPVKRTIQAFQYDGTLSGAYQLLAWLTGRGGYGYWNPDTGNLMVIEDDAGHRIVASGEYVLWVGKNATEEAGGSVTVITDEEMAAQYTTATFTPAHGVDWPGHHHKPGCRCSPSGTGKTRGFTDPY